MHGLGTIIELNKRRTSRSTEKLPCGCVNEYIGYKYDGGSSCGMGKLKYCKLHEEKAIIEQRLKEIEEELKMTKAKKTLYCICGKEIATYTGTITGITTWFPVCSECLYGVEGWTKEDMDKLKEQNDTISREVFDKLKKKK